MFENTAIARHQNKQDLITAEALFIKEERPIINPQTDDLIEHLIFSNPLSIHLLLK